MLDEQLEFAISQFADGSLPSADRAALESRLAAEPALAALLAEYRALDSAMTSLSPLPAIAWDRLAVQISTVISEQDEAVEPARGYVMPWVRRVGGFAVAACVLIAVGIGVHDRMGKPLPPAVARGEISITGPTPEVASADAKIVQEITIGPSPSLALTEDGARYGDSGVVSHHQRVVIASEDAPAQDGASTPY